MGFPKWVKDPLYLPTIEDISKIKPDPKTGNCGFSDFIAHNPLGTPFQVLNKEFIEGVSSELLKVIKNISNESITILEVGAGNGRLSYFLKKYLTIEDTKKSIEIIAADNFSWFTNEFEEDTNGTMFLNKCEGIEVVDLEMKNAIEKYNPKIIISSWMPDNEDWTLSFRENKNIDYFILIGIPDNCGTTESWKSCDTFKGKEVKIKGSISWRDGSNNISYITSDKFKPQSKVFLFKRNNV